MIYKSAEALIGNTPLLEVNNIMEDLGLKARILVKLEYLNPTGSVKDRAAKYMLQDAEEKGILKEGSVIIEPTSGNTGIGLASLATAKGRLIVAFVLLALWAMLWMVNHLVCVIVKRK